jgi:hypothetical protein
MNETEKRAGNDIHPTLGVLVSGSEECHMLADPDEAAAAFERGREYVRTGAMPC